MNNLAHWNPFKSIARSDLGAGIDEMLRGLGTRSPWRYFEMAPEIRIDVSETDTAYQVTADLPGVNRNDIDVSVEGNRVAISAEIRREISRPQGEKDLYTERCTGRIQRAFTLPSELDSAAAGAKYEDGVLTLTLPKKNGGTSRRIAIR